VPGAPTTAADKPFIGCEQKPLIGTVFQVDASSSKVVDLNGCGVLDRGRNTGRFEHSACWERMNITESGNLPSKQAVQKLAALSWAALEASGLAQVGQGVEPQMRR